MPEMEVRIPPQFNGSTSYHKNQFMYAKARGDCSCHRRTETKRNMEKGKENNLIKGRD